VQPPQARTRNLELAAFGYGAATLLALLCVAIAAAFGVFPGRANSVAALAIVGAGSGGVAAWRLWDDDTSFATGALAYVSVFALGVAAVVALLSPAVLSLVFNQLCGQGACAALGLLSGRQQDGYTYAGIAAAIGVGAAFFGVFFLTAERHRRARL
jgi:hypothetical protein